MQTWIALFRGINVVGKNLLSMDELQKDLEALKFKNVRTYIQSGNVIFDSTHKSASSLSKLIAKMLMERYQLYPQLKLLEPTELIAALDSNPFPQATRDPASLHLFFLSEAPLASKTAKLKAIKTETENFRLLGKIFYLHTPDGFGRSKLASNVEKHLGVTATARNYRTVIKLRCMLQDT
jgi:uncharacterized protein (DUF1697 family)